MFRTLKNSKGIFAWSIQKIMKLVIIKKLTNLWKEFDSKIISIKTLVFRLFSRPNFKSAELSFFKVDFLAIAGPGSVETVSVFICWYSWGFGLFNIGWGDRKDLLFTKAGILFDCFISTKGSGMTILNKICLIENNLIIFLSKGKKDIFIQTLIFVFRLYFFLWRAFLLFLLVISCEGLKPRDQKNIQENETAIFEMI